jgi:hypothetical protein
MTILTDAPRFRRVTAGVSLIGFSGLLLVDEVIDTGPSTAQEFYGAAATGGDRLIWAAVVLLLSAVLTIPAIYGIVHQARDRGTVLAHLGGALSMLGALGHTAIATLYVAMLSLAGGGRDEMLAYADRLLNGTAAAILIVPLIICFPVGMALLAFAAWRAGLVPGWGPALVSLAALTAFLPTGGEAVALTAYSVLTAVYTWIGVHTLRLRDAEWDTVPPLGSLVERSPERASRLPM